MSIKLHGIIAKKFGVELDMPSEIDESFLFDILNTKFNGFRLFIQRQAQKGVFYQTVKRDEDYHIVPVICGHIGALGGVLGSLGGNFLGSSLIGGIMGMITPNEDQSESLGVSTTVILQSTRFSGLENKERQGSKVPVGYGRLKIGSKLIMQHVRPISWTQYREIENTTNFPEVGIEYFNPTEK
jgi:predicted phage tail protein